MDEKCVDGCASVGSSRRKSVWIDSTVTMGEKYCLCDNSVLRKHLADFDALPQPEAKHPDHDKKVLLSLQCGISHPVFSKLVPTGSVVNSDTFCIQLENTSQILRKRWPRQKKKEMQKGIE